MLPPMRQSKKRAPPGSNQQPPKENKKSIPLTYAAAAFLDRRPSLHTFLYT